MLKSDYANGLMLAKMEIHRLQIENNKLRTEAASRLCLFPAGIFAAILLLMLGDIITSFL